MHRRHGWDHVLALHSHAVSAYISVIERNEAPRTGSYLSKAQGKGIIMNVARTFNNWRKYRQTVSELGRMSTRELNDLGIARGDIERIAKAAAL
jgi:uncharacterized protein YjiS (DUF1127 family)